MATCTIACQYIYPDLLEEVKIIILQREDQSRETLRMEWIVWSSTRAGSPSWQWPNLILCGNMQLWQLMLTDTSLAGFKMGSLWNQTDSQQGLTTCWGAVQETAPSPLWAQTCPLWLAQDYIQGSCVRKRGEPEFSGKHWVTFLHTKIALIFDKIL